MRQIVAASLGWSYSLHNTNYAHTKSLNLCENVRFFIPREKPDVLSSQPRLCEMGLLIAMDY